MSAESVEAVGIREQDSLCVRHIIKSRVATAGSPLFLGCSMDKASVRGLDFLNTLFTVPVGGFGFEGMPQALKYIYLPSYMPTYLPTYLLTCLPTYLPA